MQAQITFYALSSISAIADPASEMADVRLTYHIHRNIDLHILDRRPPQPLGWLNKDGYFPKVTLTGRGVSLRL